MADKEGPQAPVPQGGQEPPVPQKPPPAQNPQDLPPSQNPFFQMLLKLQQYHICHH